MARPLRKGIRSAIGGRGAALLGLGFCAAAWTFVVSISRYVDVPSLLLISSATTTSGGVVAENEPASDYSNKQDPYSASIQVQTFQRPSNFPKTPNFIDILAAKNCTASLRCVQCLNDVSRRGDFCQEHNCGKICECICSSICHEKVESKFVATELVVTPPYLRAQKSDDRLVPRIIHQTWFENITEDTYPVLTSYANSFRQTGWDYRFYSDDDARDFLTTFYPPEIRETFDALVEGAFKADLFRYAVLLVHGGLYADVDIQLVSDLETLITDDVGFVVPQDLGPSINRQKQPCALNSFIAAAPGHPFLAKALETAVNQIRNRFTVLDFDATYCPDPDIAMVHHKDMLYTAGPCLLGASINRVLGRHPQTTIPTGELHKVGSVSSSHEVIPGRTLILKYDAFRHRGHHMIWQEKNMVVASTRLESLDNETRLRNRRPYYFLHELPVLYGLQRVYVDTNKANENIRIRVVGK